MTTYLIIESIERCTKTESIARYPIIESIERSRKLKVLRDIRIRTLNTESTARLLKVFKDATPESRGRASFLPPACRLVGPCEIF